MKPAFSGWYWQKQTIISQLWGGLMISTALLLLGCCSYQIDWLSQYHFSASIHVPEILIFFGTCGTLEEDIHFHRIAFHNLTHFPHQIEQNLLSTSYWTIFHNSSIYTFHLHQIATKLSKNIIFQGTLPFFCDKSWPKQEGWLRWEKKLNVWQVPA